MEFKDDDLKAFWDDPDSHPARHVPPDLRKLTYRKLQILSAAHTLQDLRVPPGNRLEKLIHNRKGQYSIRVNDRFRLCFIWTDEGAKEVEFVDHH